MSHESISKERVTCSVYIRVSLNHLKIHKPANQLIWLNVWWSRVRHHGKIDDMPLAFLQLVAVRLRNMEGPEGPEGRMHSRFFGAETKDLGILECFE